MQIPFECHAYSGFLVSERGGIRFGLLKHLQWKELPK